MKCYVAGSSNYQEFEYVDTCFAGSLKEAKSFLWKNSHRLLGECDGDYTDLRVVRQKSSDRLLDKDKTEAYLVVNNHTLRQMGWRNEGERACDSCGLCAKGLDKFEVCDSCGQCGECGCDDECEDHQN